MSRGTYYIQVILCLLVLLIVGCQNPSVSTANTQNPKAITALSFPKLNDANADINEKVYKIEITVPHGTDVTSLEPIIVHTGVSISPTGPQDFSSEVTYTVIAADGSEQVYRVSVTVAESGTKAITALSFPALNNVNGVIDETTHTITITVPHGTDVTSLTPAITHTGASISPTAAQDFSSPVSYTVRAADGSRQVYRVSVKVAERSFTLAFNSQRGSAVPSQTITRGGLATRPTPPSRNGYGFGNWYKESRCVNLWDFSTDVVTGDTTLYAKWYPVSAGLRFTPINNGSEYSVSGSASLRGSIDIPKYWNGLPVTTIADDAFRDAVRLTRIAIPDTVTSIGSSAFFGARRLTRITIPRSVTSIGRSAFRNCTSLKNLYMRPASAPTLGSDVFRNVSRCALHIPRRNTGYDVTPWISRSIFVRRGFNNNDDDDDDDDDDD